MIRLSNTESVLIEELLDCIAEAIGKSDSVSREYTNKTKLQKLLYFAIEEYDLPITYSWYLAGAVVPDRNIGPSSLPSPQSPSSPSMPSQSAEKSIDGSADEEGDGLDYPIDELAETSVDSSTEYTTSEKQAPTIDPIMFSDDFDSQGNTDDITSVFEVVSRPTLIDFYTDIIPDVWSQNTMRFLQNFYQEAAPPAFRSLYIESTHLRTHLMEIIETVKAHRTGKEPTQSVKEIEPQLGRTISDLHYYLRGIEELRETLPLVIQGTDLIEDTVGMLATKETNEYTEAHVSALKQLKEFFYYHVWRYPCLRISRRTVAGPSADELSQEHQAAYERFPERFENRYAESVTAVRTAELYPDPLMDLEPRDDVIAQKLTDLSSEYLK